MGHSDEGALRQAIVDACRGMNAAAINQGKSGNISARIPSGMLITPTGIAYEALTADRIVPMTLDGAHRGDFRPSSEWRIHADIYRARDEAGAIVHAHPRYATALACQGRGIPPFHYMVAVAGGIDIRCAPYATFGTQALSDNALAALAARRACLLANHGMIAFGATVDAALALAIEVESLAAQYWASLQIGTPNLLTDDEMTRVLDAFAAYGQQPALSAIGEDEDLLR